MNIFERLPVDDVVKIQNYINYYGGSHDASSHMMLDTMDYFLHFWRKDKEKFYKMFGEQFILKRDVSFTKDPESLEDQMRNVLRYENNGATIFTRHYCNVIESIEYAHLTYEQKYELKRFVGDYEMLARNEYNGDPFCIPASITVDGKPFQLNKGGKAVKMLGKICKVLGISCPVYHCTECGGYHGMKREDNSCFFCSSRNSVEVIEGYECFRQAHSLVLNQKKITGTLCLSIHPLDFITASDNDCGWSSCMQWMEEAGDYRLGTIEMMNSPFVIVAYVEAKDNMLICNGRYEWNSKKWRQFVVVTPELILGNKQYPYMSDDLQGITLRWVRDLVNSYRNEYPEDGYGFFPEEAVNVINHRINTFGTRKVSVCLDFDYMYNDIYDNRMGFLASNFADQSLSYNLSGPAVCTNCGAVIDYDSDTIDPSWTVCCDCSGTWKCSCCGDWCQGEPHYTEDSDRPLCHYCYTHETAECEICGDTVMTTEPVFIEILHDTDSNDRIDESYNWTYVIDACANCLNHRYGDFKKMFGEIHFKADMYGIRRKVVYLENITNTGLDCGDLGIVGRQLLKDLRAIDSDEGRLELLRERLY